MLREALTGEAPPQGTETGLSLVREWIARDAGGDLTALSMLLDDQAAFAETAKLALRHLDLIQGDEPMEEGAEDGGDEDQSEAEESQEEQESEDGGAGESQADARAEMAGDQADDESDQDGPQKAQHACVLPKRRMPFGQLSTGIRTSVSDGRPWRSEGP